MWPKKAAPADYGSGRRAVLINVSAMMLLAPAKAAPIAITDLKPATKDLSMA